MKKNITLDKYVLDLWENIVGIKEKPTFQIKNLVESLLHLGGCKDSDLKKRMKNFKKTKDLITYNQIRMYKQIQDFGLENFLRHINDFSANPGDIIDKYKYTSRK